MSPLWQKSLAPAALAILVGCGITPKRDLVAATFKNYGERQEFLEATLDVLDRHPEYVDEFFEHALMHHPKTLERFIADTAARLNDAQLAALTAKYLAQNPDSLHQILVQTLLAANEPPPKRAIAGAISDQAARSMADVASDPRAQEVVSLAFLDLVAHDPEARRPFLAGLAQRQHEMSQVIATDPAVLAGMVDALLSLAERDPRIAAVLVAQTVRALKNPGFAKITAAELAAHPETLAEVLLQTIASVEPSPGARAAMAKAIQADAPQVAAILAQHPASLAAVTEATLGAVAHNAPAQSAFVQVVKEHHQQLAQMLLSDPQATAAFVKDFAGRTASRGLLGNRLRSVFGRQPPPAASPPGP